MSCTAVRDELRTRGLLLQQDKRLPSVVGIITGEQLATSWWSHPKGQEIFACLESLSEDEDVLTTRLIAGKVTFVHRSLWTALLIVATSGEPWQTRGLSPAARSLLRKAPIMASGPAARALQERMLVRAEQVHTERGRHETRITPWPEMKTTMSIDEARTALESAAVALGASPKTLPWKRF